MANIKRPIQIFNGTAWDKILPEISEDMIKSGWTQNIGSVNGYKKMPGGLIIQWGYATGVSSTDGSWVTLPLAFPSDFMAVVASTDGAHTAGAEIMGSDKHRFILKSNSGSKKTFWIAIGY